MSLYISLFLYIFTVSWHITAEETEITHPRKNLSISVVIPCVPKHFQHLHHLLSHYAQQTVLPQEIIIALSESHRISQSEIDKFNQHPWPFSVHLVPSREKLLAGANRNRGASYAQGDLLLFQDADDIPHPQIIEIGKYFFETKDIVHMLYWYIPRAGCYCPNYKGPIEFVSYIPQNIEFTTYYNDSAYYGYHGSIQNGQCFVLRSVLNTVQFLTNTSYEEDVNFNREVMKAFLKSILVKAHLSLWRKSLSATDYSNCRPA